MALTDLALRRPVTTSMVFACLFVIGLVGSQRLPLEFLPEIRFPGIWIEVPYRNSSPEDVERRITRPVEEAVATMTGVNRMRSESRETGTGMWVEFGWGEDMTVKGVDARDKIDALRDQLPADLGRVQIFKFNAADAPIMTVRISAEQDLSQAFDMLNRNLTRPLERLPGVSRVTLYGVEPKEVRIELSAARVAAHGIDLRELGTALASANFAISAGEIVEGGQRYLLRPLGRFDSLEAIADQVIGPRGLRLGDIAEVRYVDPVLTYGRHLNGRYAIGLDVFKETGANMVDVAAAVQDEITRIGRQPDMRGINLYVMQNQADDVTESLRELLTSGLLGALLSLCVLYAFLRNLRMTLIVTLAVPVSLMITLGAMYFLGFSLNILTLMGLMLSVGLLVDNGVVVTESIAQERQRTPDDPHVATLRGCRAVGLAVAAGTLTTAIVFLPNVFGEKNDIAIFLTHVAVTICISLGASLLVALTLIPQLTSRLKVSRREADAGESRLRRSYVRLLRWTLAHGGWSTVLVVLILASVMLPARQVDFDMFPQENSRQLMLRYNVNAQYALHEVETSVRRIEAWLLERQDELGIESVYSYFDLGRAESTIRLLSDDVRPLPIDTVRDRIRDGIPKIPIGIPSFEQNRRGSRDGLSVRVQGEHTDALRETAHEVARVLRTVEGLTDIRVDMAAADSEVRVNVDRARTQQAGLDSQTVAETIATAMRGQQLRPYQTRTGEVDLILQFSSADRRDLNQLLNLPIRTPSGNNVSLSSLATLEYADVPGNIRREDRRTAVSIMLATQDITPDEARTRIRAMLDPVELPAGTTWDFGRAFDEDAAQATAMLVNMALALVCIYIVMAALFEAVLAPTAIITGVLFSFIGVIWFFFLTSTTFSFMALIGMLLLMGIVVNNGIVMIDHVSRLRRSGLDRTTALIDGASERLRPILMTVGTTVLGMLPLSLGEASVGGNGPPYYPMARAIIGGLVFSTVVSLILLPSIYLWMDDLGHWGRRVLARARGVATTEFAPGP